MRGVTADVRLEVLTGEREFLALEPEWNALLQRSRSNNVFLTWEWVSAWWDSFRDGYQPRLLVAREPAGGRLLGVAPLALRRRSLRGLVSYRELSFIGDNVAAPDHLDFVIDADHEAAVARAFVSHLQVGQGQWDVLRLKGVSSESVSMALLMQAARLEPGQPGSILCPFIRLPASWEAFNAGLSKNTRYNLGRNARRLEKEYPGQVTFRQVAHEAELATAMPALFRLHQQVRRTHGDAGAFSDARMAAFHRQVAHTFLRNGWLRLHVLTVGAEDIAMLYCFAYGGVVSFYQSGYSLAWKRHAPGRQIMAHAIRQAIDEGAREFDFLRGDEAYKFSWTDQARSDLDLKLPATVRGRFLVRAYSFARAARARLKRNG